MSSTARGRARENLDFYQTPPWPTDLVLDELFAPSVLPCQALPPPEELQALESAAGAGAIVKRLLARGVRRERIDAIEIDPGRADIVRGLVPCVECADFTTITNGPPYDLIITNPPFALAADFARVALGMAGLMPQPDERHTLISVEPTQAEIEKIQRLHPTAERADYGLIAAAMRPRAASIESKRRGTVALLLRLNWLGSQERAAFHRAHPSDILLLPKRPEFTASMSCSAKKSGCEYKATLPIEVARPKTCPLCGARTVCSTTDSIEYAWFVWGPGRGNRWGILPMPTSAD